MCDENSVNRGLPINTQMAGQQAAPQNAWQVDLPMNRVTHHFHRCVELAVTEIVTIKAGELAAMANEIRRRRPIGEQIVEGIARGQTVRDVVQESQERSNRLAGKATKAVADVAFVGNVRPADATAIVQVANMLNELMQWRSGERVSDNLVARDLVHGGMTVRGSAEAMAYLSKQLAELESARQMIQELERMGWLMKAKP